jgi:hypothetical protein
MIALLLFLQIIPHNESIVYETNEKGKIGKLTAESQMDSLGLRVDYVSDREITVILDTSNLSTIYARKIINGELVFEMEKGSAYDIYFNGFQYRRIDRKPVYDRHTLDFALRGFDYHIGFKDMFRLHVPELTIVNAELEVIGEESIVTPAGVFDCWKVQMKPRIIFINRRFFFYIEKEYPRRFVKYADPSGESSITLIEYQNNAEMDES